MIQTQTILKDRSLFYRIAWYAGCTAIVSYPVSISLSQAAVVLAFCAWILGIVRGADVPRFRAPAVLIAGLAIYGFELMSLLILSTKSGGLAFLKPGLSKEIKDVFLISGAFWIFAFSETAEERRRVEKMMTIAIGILLVSGLVAVFSRYRLNHIPYHLLHGWEGTTQARYQHHAGTFFAGTPLQFHIYIPVGFLHSHLTYGALLMMAVPILFVKAAGPFLSGKVSIFPFGAGMSAEQKTDRSRTLFAMVVLACAGLLFMINNARSAILGTVFVLALTIYYYSRFHWKKRALWLLLPIAGVLIVFAGMVLFADLLHERLRALVVALTGQEKHTDYQRVLLWNASIEVIRDHLWLGVGAGHFQESIEALLLTQSQAHPALWYANETLQRGHSHSDPLHIQAIAGIGGFAAYITFFALLIHRTIKANGRALYRFGAAGLFIAGLYQCYLLDDAVLLPFWLYTGMMLRETEGSVAPAEIV